MNERRKDRITVYIGGMLTALLASACCIGPALFLAFGITGLGFLSRFEWLRPYFLLLTLVLVGISYRYAYGRGSNCGTDGTCNLPARRINRILFWVLVGFAVFGFSFPYIAAWLLD
ncbi:MAG: hypothetical protein HY887_05360 [Deltaproteobacteria bacterium]|nr:hypothetical protein [Deltaproteobacteria bacterium]